MDKQSIIGHIRSLISKDQLSEALENFNTLLEGSPLLDQVIQQSARFSDIRKQIRQGVTSKEDSNLTLNQIRAACLDLLREVEETCDLNPEIKKEVSKTSVMLNQKAEKIYNIDKIDKADFS